MNKIRKHIFFLSLYLNLFAAAFFMPEMISSADIAYLKNDNLIEGVILEVNEDIIIIQTPLGILEFSHDEVKGIEKKEYPTEKLKAYPASGDVGLWLPLERESVGAIALEISQIDNESERREYTKRYNNIALKNFRMSQRERNKFREHILLLKSLNAFEIVRHISADHKAKWEAQKKINRIEKILSAKLKIPEFDSRYDAQKIIQIIESNKISDKKRLARDYFELAVQLESLEAQDMLYLRSACASYYVAYSLAEDDVLGLKAQRGYKRCSLKVISHP